MVAFFYRLKFMANEPGKAPLGRLRSFALDQQEKPFWVLSLSGFRRWILKIVCWVRLLKNLVKWAWCFRLKREYWEFPKKTACFVRFLTFFSFPKISGFSRKINDAKNQKHIWWLLTLTWLLKWNNSVSITPWKAGFPRFLVHERRIFEMTFRSVSGCCHCLVYTGKLIILKWKDSWKLWKCQCFEKK